MKISRMKLKMAIGAVLIGMGSTLFYGCNPVAVGNGYGLSGTGDRISDTTYFTNQVQPIFTSRCVTCHKSGGSGYAATGLDLSTGNAYLNLLGSGTGKASSEVPATLRVKSGDADNSFLYQKINLAVPASGGRMPLDGTVLSSEQIAIIKTWIQNGAHGPEGINQ
jgi:mono/diheme cytochrome c family protein